MTHPWRKDFNLKSESKYIFVTPLGRFNNALEMEKAHGFKISREVLRKRCKDNFEGYSQERK